MATDDTARRGNTGDGAGLLSGEPTDQETVRTTWQQCPLYQADDKFAEAHYFLERMMAEYHEPEHFRWNLNAFVQALRSVTFYIQKLLKHEQGFDAWYEGQRAVMTNDALLGRFVKGRNAIVKERNLLVESAAAVGVYRYRKPKLGLRMSVPPHQPSRQLLSLAAKLELLDEKHAAEGEEYGIEREWRVPELGTENVLDLCDEAWIRIGEVLESGHEFIGWQSPGPKLHRHRSEDCALLTETDVDPKLAELWWGWSRTEPDTA